MRKHQQPPVPRIQKKKKSRFSVTSAVRICLQILFFIWLPSLYISAFSGLQEIFTALVTGTFSLSALWPDLLAFTAVVPLTILSGRFFCGWMCAFGALTDWVFRIFSRWTKNKVMISGKGDFVLKILKYVLLAVLLGLGWLAGSLSLSVMSPWDAFGMLFTVGAVPALVFVLQSLLPGFILLILILFASAFIERFFCRYLCPMGAFFALTSAARVVYIDKPREGCGKCQICTKNCAMGLPLNQMDRVTSGECISCMKCVDVCPRKNVKVRAVKTQIPPAVTAAVAAALITGLFLFSSFLTSAAAESSSGNTTASSTTASSTAESFSGSPATSAAAVSTAASAAASAENSTANSALSTASSAGGAGETTAASTAVTTASTAAVSAETTSASSGIYKDGTYQGSGTGFRGGTTTVEVTVSGGQISNIKVISYQDDQPYFDRAFPAISSAVISSQSTAVDVVSHATYSSDGIIGAIEDALAQAKN